MLAPVNALFFVGDSNCLIYHNRIVDRPEFFARPFVTREMFVAGISLVEAAFGTERFWTLIAALEQERLVTRPGVRPSNEGKQKPSAHWFLRTQLTGPQMDIMNAVSVDPAVVLFAGTMDVSNVLARFGPNFDFWLEDERYRPSAFAHEPVVALTPRGIVDAVVAEMIAAFRTGVVALRDAGLGNLMIHSLHPSSMDSDRYFRIRGIESLARARYKTVILFNRYLAELARECDVGFLDLWDRTTVDGVLDTRLSLDGDHLNLEAARLTVNEVLDALLRRRGRPLPKIPAFLSKSWSH